MLIAAIVVIALLAAVAVFSALKSRDADGDRKSTRLNSSHNARSRMPSSA